MHKIDFLRSFTSNARSFFVNNWVLNNLIVIKTSYLKIVRLKDGRGVKASCKKKFIALNGNFYSKNAGLSKDMFETKLS